MEKELGKLTSDQLARLLALQDAVHQMAKLNAEIANSPRVRALLARRDVFFQWSWMYEVSFAEMIVAGLAVIGEHGMLTAAAAAEDPQEHFITDAEAYDPGPYRPKASQLLQGIAYAMAGYHSLRSIELYSRPINRLIADGRGGDDEAFLKAVRVDPTCLSAPSLAKRVSVAVMREERKFLRRVHKAASEGPNKGFESPRLSRRLQTLRGWSHEQVNEVRTRGA